jgi:hypothetical protein
MVLKTCPGAQLIAPGIDARVTESEDRCESIPGSMVFIVAG